MMRTSRVCAEGWERLWVATFAGLLGCLSLSWTSDCRNRFIGGSAKLAWRWCWGWLRHSPEVCSLGVYLYIYSTRVADVMRTKG